MSKKIDIVISISEALYSKLMEMNSDDACSFNESALIEVIQNGTPLPKGHGRLIDKDALIGKIHGVKSITAVLDAKTIIEADRAERSD